MKKIFLATSFILFSMTSHAKTVNAAPKGIEGCTHSMNYSGPTGSDEFCFSNDGKFMGAGFGYMKFGYYQIKDNTIELRFQRPEMFDLITTYDPNQQGTRIELAGFYEGSRTAKKALASLNGQSFHSMIDAKNDCKDYPYFKVFGEVSNIRLIDSIKEQPYIWQFEIPKRHNRVVITYMDADHWIYEPHNMSFRMKNKKIFFLNEDGKVVKELKPWDKNSEDYQYFMQEIKNLDNPPKYFMSDDVHRRPLDDDTKYYIYNQADNTYSIKPEYYDMFEFNPEFEQELNKIRRYQILKPKVIPTNLKNLDINQSALFADGCKNK